MKGAPDTDAPPGPPLPAHAAVVAFTTASALGAGRAAQSAALAAGRSGLTPNDYPDSGLETYIGRVAELDGHDLPERFAALDSRNNRLADLALALDGFEARVQTASHRFGSARVGVLLGTSTASIGRTESAYAALEDGRIAARFDQPRVHNPHSVAHYVAARLGIDGPCMTISTACSSSGKVFAAGARWLAAGLVDAVVVGGVDSLCLSILHGFASLELVSRQPCRPFDARRDGISIGEAAGFALLVMPERAQELDALPIVLAGAGETSDAWHMAQPHPDGRGAGDAMRLALGSAGLAPSDIGYVNLHGTATPANDRVEAQALADLFSPAAPASSTKGYTGHTLGAAGVLGAVTVMESLLDERAPAPCHLDQPGDDIVYPISRTASALAQAHAMSNSFGFGGNNCALIFSRSDA